jgi:hypothetical protein
MWRRESAGASGFGGRGALCAVSEGRIEDTTDLNPAHARVRVLAGPPGLLQCVENSVAASYFPT